MWILLSDHHVCRLNDHQHFPRILNECENNLSDMASLPPRSAAVFYNREATLRMFISPVPVFCPFPLPLDCER